MLAKAMSMECGGFYSNIRCLFIDSFLLLFLLVAANKEDNAWTVITTGGWNKWANNGFVVHGKGSALGPTLKWMRSTKPKWLKETKRA